MPGARHLRTEGPPLAGMCVAILAAYLPVVTLQQALFYFDISEHNAPFRHFFATALREGRLPLWTDRLNAGFPIFAEGQAGPLHPLNAVFHPWMDTWAATNLTHVLHVLLAALGAYALVRPVVMAWSAALAGVAFALCGAVLTHHFHLPIMTALAVLPLFLASWRWLMDGPTTGRWALSSLLLACIHLAGHPQTTLLALLASALMLVVPPGSRHARAHVRDGGLLVALVGVGTALAAAQLLPTLELAPLSVRGQALTLAARSESSQPPSMLLQWLFPHASGSLAMGTQRALPDTHFHEVFNWVGMPVLLLACLGLLHAARRAVASFALLAVVSFLLSLGKHAPLFAWVSSLPGVDHLRIPSRANLLVDLALACLAALGMDVLLHVAREGPRRIHGVAPVVFMVLAGAAWALHGAGSPTAEEWSADLWMRGGMLVGCVVLACAAAWMRRPAWVLGVAALVAVDMGHFTRDFLPTVPPSYWTRVPPAVEMMKRVDPDARMTETDCTPPTYEPRGWQRSGSTAHHRALDRLTYNVPLLYDVATTRGYTPLRLQSFHEAVIRVRERGDVPEGLGSRFLVSCKAQDKPTLHLLGESDGIRVYESSATRRAFMAHPRGSTNTPPLRPLVEIAGAQPVVGNGACGEDRVDIVQRADEELEVEVITGCAGHLVVLDANYPGWTATVDGVETPILVADRAFRAVAVGAGAHKVRFVFRSASFRTGVAISLGTALLLALACVLAARRRSASAA